MDVPQNPLPPDMLRGTQIARWAGLDQESICICGHKFGIHVTFNHYYNVGKRCQYCGCNDFVLMSEDMATSTNKQMEQNGYDLAQKWAKIFVLNENADYQDKVSLGMVFANQQGLNLETGASFVKGFVDGLSADPKARSKHLTMEDKINLLLERELERKLPQPSDAVS